MTILLLQSGPGRTGGIAPGVATVTLSSSTVLETAAIGTTIGALVVVNGTGTYAFALTVNPGSLFAISGSNLTTAAALSAGSFSITVEATGGTPSPVTASFLITATVVIVDEDIANVVLLMGFDGLDESVGSPGMDDESGAAHGTATVHEDAEISMDQSVFGGSSLLAGTGWLTFADSDDWYFSDQPFTVEFRMHPTNIGFCCLIGQWQTAPDLGWMIYQNNFSIGVAFSTDGTDNNADIDSGDLAGNTWFAIALDFDGTTYRLYVDGAMVGSSVILRDLNDSPLPLSIGATAEGNYNYTGFLEEVRITKGVARYASDDGYVLPSSDFVRPGVFAELTLTGSTVAEDVAVGTTIGTLVVIGAVGSHTFSITSDASGLFAISGSNLTSGAALAAGSYPITVASAGGIPSPSHSFMITVTAVSLALTGSTVSESAAIGATVGVLSVTGGTGSYSYALTSNPGTLFGISGANLTVAAALTEGTYPISVEATGDGPTPITGDFTVMVTEVLLVDAIEMAWFDGLPYPGVEIAARDAGTAKYWFNGGVMPILKD